MSAVRPPSIQRHRLAWLADAAWDELRAMTAWDAQAQCCLAHWREHRLPLVVARQPQAGQGAAAWRGHIHLGLPMPNRWGRGRLAIPVAPAAIRAWGAFPAAAMAAPLLPAPCQQPWRALCAQWQDEDCAATVYGGYGWQLLSGQTYLRSGSDIDLILPVQDARHADRIAAALQASQACEAPVTGGMDIGMPRIDGELVFPDHCAVNWREWTQWRSGHASGILVKRIDGVRMHAQPWWPSPYMAQAKDVQHARGH